VLNFGGALVNFGDARVAVVTLGWHVRYEAHPTEHLWLQADKESKHINQDEEREMYKHLMHEFVHSILSSCDNFLLGQVAEQTYGVIGSLLGQLLPCCEPEKKFAVIAAALI